MRCCVRWPRAPTRGLSENGARRRTAPASAPPSSTRLALSVSADLVLDCLDDRGSRLPVGDAVLLQRDRVLVLVQSGPVRMIQLVEGEARLERVVETHV